MDIFEKLDRLSELYIEIACEIESKAELVKENRPLYRMLIEEGSSRLRNDFKNFETSGFLETLKSRIKTVDIEISKIKS